MKCDICGNVIENDIIICPYCNVYIGYRDNGKHKLIVCGETFYLNFRNGKIKIGRRDLKSLPDIDLGPFDSNLTVSRIHCYIIYKDGHYYIYDVSKNGICINDVKILKKSYIELQFPCILKIGGVVCKIE